MTSRQEVEHGNGRDSWSLAIFVFRLPRTRQGLGVLDEAGEALDEVMSFGDVSDRVLPQFGKHPFDVFTELLTGRVQDELRLCERVLAEGSAELYVVVHRAADHSHDLVEGVGQIEDLWHLHQEAVLAEHGVDAAQCMKLSEESFPDCSEIAVLGVLLDPGDAGVASLRTEGGEPRTQMDGGFCRVEVLDFQHHARGHRVLSFSCRSACQSSS